MICIQVGSNHHFKPIAPKFLSKSNTDFMSRICLHFTGFERLITMIAGATTRFTELLFCAHKTVFGIRWDAIYAGNIMALFGFYLVCSIFHYIIDRMQGS